MKTKQTIFSNPPKGFRLFKSDLALLALGVGLPWFFSGLQLQMAILFSISIFHFFLFCNVFRTKLVLEILWAVLFVAHFLYRFDPHGVDWVWLLLWQSPVTLGVVVIEIFTGTYRGIFYQHLSK